MDLTNRILIIGGALIWIFVVMVIILLAWGAPDESIARVFDLAEYMEDHNTTEAKLIITFGGLILVLLAAIVVVIEVAPPQAGRLKVANVGEGEASIPSEEVAHLLEEELVKMPHLNQVQAKVQARGQKAEVNLDLHVGAEADLAATTEEACHRAAELLRQRIGVELARPPQAQLHYQELRVAQPQASAGSSVTSPEPALPTGSETTHEASETAHEDRPAGG